MSFEISAKFMFTYEGNLKFENTSNSKYDIMIHYLNENAEKKTQYVNYNGSKYARDFCKKIIFQDEFVYDNEFTGKQYEIPLACLSIFPKENRKYANKTPEEKNKWNSTVIKDLNIEYWNSFNEQEELEIYRDYYKNKYLERKKEEGGKRENENVWKTKRLNIKEDTTNEILKNYQGLTKLERITKLTEEIKILSNLKRKLEFSNIKFNFEFESEFFNYNSKTDE